MKKHISINNRKLARVVEWNGLENRHTERYLGFESLSFRTLYRGEIGYLSYNPANTPTRLVGKDKEIEK